MLSWECVLVTSLMLEDETKEQSVGHLGGDLTSQT